MKKVHTLNYRGCGSCAHASGTHGKYNSWCKLWTFNFPNSHSCDAYHRFDEPFNPFDENETPLKKEELLRKERKNYHLEVMNYNQWWRFSRFHAWYVKQYETGITDLILPKDFINKNIHDGINLLER